VNFQTSCPAPSFKRTLRYLAWGVAITLPAPMAFAQSSAPGPAAPQAGNPVDAGQVEEIVVTARRREEKEQTVPIALTALSSHQIEAEGIYGLTQIEQEIPSMNITVVNPNNVNINIRGLGANASFSSIGLDSGVGIYVDQVYLPRPTQSVFDQIDLDRVEVLRGPQGTLFGKNTTAGAVNITTKAPTFEYEAVGEVTGGNYGQADVRAAASGPVVPDLLAFRLTVADTNHDGFIRNVLLSQDWNDYHDVTARAQLLFTPVDNLRARFIADYEDQNETCCEGVLEGVVTTRVNGTPFPNGFYARVAPLGYTPLPIDPFARKTDADSPQFVHTSQGGASAIVDWDINDFTVTSVTAWRYWSYSPGSDADALALPILTNAAQTIRESQESQELRLASPTDQPIEYVAGLYYFHQATPALATTQYGSAAAQYAVSTSAAPYQAALNGFTVYGNLRLNRDSFAPFGQATWHITSQLSLTAGLRYNDEDKTGYFSQSQAGGVNLGSLSPAVAATAQALRNAFGPITSFYARTAEHTLTGQANLAYQLTDDILAYATYARGSQSGGISMAVIPAGASPVVAPETASDYEVGLKSSFLDNRLVVNAAAYWEDIANYQTTISNPLTSTSYVANGGRVRSRGIELDSRAVPAKGLAVYLSAAYDDATFVSFKDGPCPIEYFGVQTVCDFSGAQLPGAPKWSFSGGGEYSRPLGDSGFLGPIDGYVGVDVSYKSSFNSTSNPSAYTVIKAYSITNARVGVRSADGNWDASLWVRNLFDDNYFESLSVTGFNTGLIDGLPGDPRTFGVTLRVKY
jgi:iron complex outermembrane receptor protein